MLALVSLDEIEANRRVRNYSLGMRQRLGIAHALLGDPSVLILDEPANGLDPAGIRWMRGLLKGYSDRGGTVLLSSHLLNEVEQIADEMILIGRGKIVARGDQGRAARRRRRDRGDLVTALDNDALTDRPGREGLGVTRRRRGLPCRGPAGRRRARRRRTASCSPTCAPAEGGLEDLFLELTSDSQRDDLIHAPPRQEPRHDHLLCVHDARRQPDSACPLQPAGLGRAAQDGGHPGGPLAAHLDRRTHRAGADHPARVVLAQDLDVTFDDFAGGANIPMDVLLPVLGIMSVTSEWSQRTAMVTFTLEPSRSRFLAAKYVGTLIIAFVAVVIGLVLTIVANFLYGASRTTRWCGS